MFKLPWTWSKWKTCIPSLSNNFYFLPITSSMDLLLLLPLILETLPPRPDTSPFSNALQHTQLSYLLLHIFFIVFVGTLCLFSSFTGTQMFRYVHCPFKWLEYWAQNNIVNNCTSNRAVPCLSRTLTPVKFNFY